MDNTNEARKPSGSNHRLAQPTAVRPKPRIGNSPVEAGISAPLLVPLSMSSPQAPFQALSQAQPQAPFQAPFEAPQAPHQAPHQAPCSFGFRMFETEECYEPRDSRFPTQSAALPPYSLARPPFGATSNSEAQSYTQGWAEQLGYSPGTASSAGGIMSGTPPTQMGAWNTQAASHGPTNGYLQQRYSYGGYYLAGAPSIPSNVPHQEVGYTYPPTVFSPQQPCPNNGLGHHLAPDTAESQKQPKPKPSKGKVVKKLQRTKDGCYTCRARRIKCDEGKPACRNCQKGKRVCDEYDKTRVQPWPKKEKK
ncbi:hypothetical protein BJ508DRAFT_348320 [Ascobolus immersus RN42]|uniref:Zn(2)-C6 fungal-type domain-containing protein n=1 Tax=Ascobolus immersus RN42 TaxID=1160509 RepID=A0A3N4HZS1_ASCIM|nr:hypothetical protein BJ508DRAFT_348320 [Ascobolus immersus RN42]